VRRVGGDKKPGVCCRPEQRADDNPTIAHRSDLIGGVSQEHTHFVVTIDPSAVLPGISHVQYA
jgi:hypothetical protein